MQFTPALLAEALITVHDVTSGNVQRLQPMLSLYRALFPDYLYYLPYLQELAYRPATADQRFVEHQWFIEVGGQAAGLINFTYVPARDCGLLMELGVHPSFRTAQVGTYARLSEFMIVSAVAQLRADAELQGRPTP
ncbi:MAG: hypothetical protein H0T73_07550, partial [Ardenticatenales bacterium]|nr:hypothetical protein [Ardenticatenales bacterium]